MTDQRTPSDLAFEQLVYGILLAQEESFPGSIEAALKAAVGGGRISVEVDRAFWDLASHVRTIARRAGYLPPTEQV